jgi:hypothetical protein
MDCNALDQLFQTLRTNGTYKVTIVSNQPDGIVGYGVTGGRWTGQSVLSGSTDRYLFSDRTVTLPSSDPIFVGPENPFAVTAPESIDVTVASQGNGQYFVQLNFTGGINRQFAIAGQCTSGAIVGTAPAIGNNEHVDDAVYVVTVGGFTEDPH